MHVPLIKPDLPPFEVVEPALREILANGRITNFGKYVEAFESASCAYVGAPHGVTVSSGTLGLLLAMQALGVRSGDKVVLPSFTFMATAQAVRYAGAVPVFAEVNDELTLDAEDLASLLAQHEDVALVIGVHMYGMPCRVEELQRVVDGAGESRGRRVPLVFDAAHAFGSAIGNRRVGSFGDAEVFSLSVTKALVCVEGGLVTTPHADVAQRLRKARNYGIEANYDAWYPGLNGKMSEFHAIVGCENLRMLDARMQRRQAAARYYVEAIESRTPFLNLPWPDGITHTFKDFTVLLPKGQEHRREVIMASLVELGVETRAYFYPPVHEQREFRQWADRPLVRTEDLARRVITLPFFTEITHEEIDYVVNALALAAGHCA